MKTIKKILIGAVTLISVPLLTHGAGLLIPQGGTGTTTFETQTIPYSASSLRLTSSSLLKFDGTNINLTSGGAFDTTNTAYGDQLISNTNGNFEIGVGTNFFKVSGSNDYVIYAQPRYGYIQLGDLNAQSNGLVFTLDNSNLKYTFAGAAKFGIGSTTPGSLLSLGDTGVNTINISTTATSTFGSGVNLRTGCFAINGVCQGIASGQVIARHKNGTQNVYTATADTDIARGTALYNANVNYSDGDILYVGAGSFDLVNNVINLDHGGGQTVSLRGSGKYETKIYSQNIVVGIVQPSDNSTVSDLAIFANAAGDVFQFPYGMTSGTAISSTTLQNVYIEGGSDGIYINGGVNTGTLTIDNVTVRSKWDAFVLISGLVKNVNIYNSDFRSMANATINNGFNTSALRTAINSSGTINVWNTILSGSGGTVSNRAVDLSGGGVMNLYSGVASSSDTLALDLRQSSGTLNVFPAFYYTYASTSGTVNNQPSIASYFTAASATATSTFLGGATFATGGGNVGIGTTTPGTFFSIGNTGANTINISPTGTSTFGNGIKVPMTSTITASSTDVIADRRLTFRETMDSTTGGIYMRRDDGTLHRFILAVDSSSAGDTEMSTYMGMDAGSVTPGSDYNAAFGYQALTAVNGGDFNNAFGRLACTTITSGSGNQCIGANSGNGITTGGDNMMLGDTAGYNSGVSGAAGSTGCTGIGKSAAREMIGGGTCIYNTYIGFQSQYAHIAGLRGSMALGANSFVDCTNCAVLGAVAGTEIVNFTGIGTTSPSAKFSVNGKAGGTNAILLISTSTATFATSTVFAIDYNGTSTFAGPVFISQTGSSTIPYIYSNTAGFGGHIIMEDEGGGTCTEITTKTGTVKAAVIACPTEINLK